MKIKPRLCSQCEHAYLGSSGVYCSFYREELWNEKIAEECEEYEPVSTGPVRIVTKIKDGS